MLPVRTAQTRWSTKRGLKERNRRALLHPEAPRLSRLTWRFTIFWFQTGEKKCQLWLFTRLFCWFVQGRAPQLANLSYIQGNYHANCRLNFFHVFINQFILWGHHIASLLARTMNGQLAPAAEKGTGAGPKRGPAVTT